MSRLPVNAPVDTETYLTFQGLLYAEARLLDSEQYEDWLDMLTEDIHYYMPMPVRYAREEKKTGSRAMEANIFNDRKQHLKLRIARFGTGFVWAENPQNHLRHVISNIEVFPTDTEGEWQVLSVVTVHRNRLDNEEHRMVVTRNDVWRVEDDQVKLAKRNMVFNHAVVPDSNLNIFF
jgi:ethylbenzene dioxygenase subunit beta